MTRKWQSLWYYFCVEHMVQVAKGPCEWHQKEKVFVKIILLLETTFVGVSHSPRKKKRARASKASNESSSTKRDWIHQRTRKQRHTAVFRLITFYFMWWTSHKQEIFHQLWQNRILIQRGDKEAVFVPSWKERDKQRNRIINSQGRRWYRSRFLPPFDLG